jgi:hypothetical protein
MSLDLRYEDVLPCSNLYLQPDERLTLAISPGSGVLEMPVLPVSISTTKLRKILSRYWTKLLWIILAYIHDTRWPPKFAWIVIAAVPSMVSSLFEGGEAMLIKVLSKHWNWEWCLYEMTGESFCELRLTSSEMPFLAISWFSLLLTRVCSTKSNVLFAQCLLTRGS